jgi:UDP-3-O-[3-hydroxymyristoyl] glucosamine N-acyltransferase
VITHRLGELAARVGGAVRGDAERPVQGIATLSAAGPDQLSFLTNAKYREAAARSRAGALLVPRGVTMAGRDLLLVDEPYLALAALLELYHPLESPPPGIHPTAVVDPTATIDATATVGPLAVVGAQSRIGPRAVLHPHAVVGARCRVGGGSILHPHSALYDGTVVGERCVVHAGVILGGDGFGYATHAGRHVKVPQVGRLVLEDDVEVGANSALDRALLEETRVGAGTKIDNLVMVAHNVKLGKSCLLVAQSGIAGSTQLGEGVVLAGQAGVAGHVRVGAGARVAAKSAVFKNVGEGEQVAGIPAIEAGHWRRQQALLGRLHEMQRRVRALEERLGVAPGGDKTEDKAPE